MRHQALHEETCLDAPAGSSAQMNSEKSRSSRKGQKFGRLVIGAVLLSLLASCASIPLKSDTAVSDKLQPVEALQPGDILIVYGVSAQLPEEKFADYFSAFSRHAYIDRRAIAYLVDTISEMNPQPGSFEVKHLYDVKKGNAPVQENSPDCVEGSGLRKFGLSKDEVLSGHLRYAIYVTESFNPKVHLPLYAMPFGIASCGQQTIFVTDVWDLKKDQYVGSFTVSAEGESVVAAWVFHLFIERDTQKDATRKLAQEIIERFTGLKPLEMD